MRNAEGKTTCIVCGFRHEEGAEESPGVALLRMVLTSAAGILLLVAFVLTLLGQDAWLIQVLLTTAVVSGGAFIAAKGLRDLLRPAFSIEFLVTVAAVGAYFIGELLEAGAIVFLFSVAELLEERSGDRVRRSLRELMDLAPRTASVRRDGSEVSVPVEEVNVGDLVLVKSGERIPVDGVVVSGEGAVNQAALTGEATPVYRRAGDSVLAGTILEEGYIEVEVTRLARDNTLSKVIHLVESVDTKRARSQRFIERFSNYYTPAVIVLAISIMLLPPLLAGADWRSWVYRGLVLLLISCPCALVISTPVSVVSAVAGAAKRGVLIKGGTYLEALATVDTVIFDKTGTLTTGKLRVETVEAFEGSPEDVLIVAASLEIKSEHHLGEAIVALAQSKGLELLAVEGFRSYPGRGVGGRVGGREVYLGSRRLLEDTAPHLMTPLMADGPQGDGGTVVYLWDREKVMGFLVLVDQPREEARETVEALHAMGLSCVMLSGDNRVAARRAAEMVGIEEVHAELLPQEKVEVVQRLQAEGRKVAMVGDGVNDAPALAAADVGIAMGLAGMDIALETADVALMGDRLSRIPYIIRLSRKTVGVIKQNSVSSIGVKLLLLILAIPGLATLWMAVLIGDMGASVGVTTNALRLART